MNKSRFESIVLQLGNKQDFTKTFTGLIDEETNEVFDCFVLADGHGSNRTINIIRKIKFEDILIKKNCMNYIIANTNKERHIFSKPDDSGSTFILVKIYSERIEIESIGDSRCVVFINNEQIYITTPHNSSNAGEMERLGNKFEIVASNCKMGKILSSTEIELKYCDYVMLLYGNAIKMTQALGHNNITGTFPEKKTINFVKEDRVRIVGASDGYWDMHNFNGRDSDADLEDLKIRSVNELALKAKNRWEQEWDYCCCEKEKKCAKICFEDIDDISLVTWEK